MTSVVAWSVVALTVATLLAVVALPKAFGWVPLTVLTPSMTPTIPVGSQVVVKRINSNEDMRELKTGDVISFLPEPDSGRVVTHRIVSYSVGSEGTVWVRTRGDANNVDDDWQLSSTQVRGKMLYHVPFVGYVAKALPSQQKRAGAYVVAVGLFGYAALQILLMFRSGRRRRCAT